MCPLGENKKGFTLAEVLITLGIIGVVAAMTLPSVIANSKRNEASARLKKFNSMMAQVLISAENDFGPVNGWDLSLSPENYVREYFAPYIKYLKIDSSGSYGRIFFTDGSTVSVRKGRCMDFYFDVNGERKPNKTGYDQFIFLACDKTITEWCPNKGWCTYYKSGSEQSRTSRRNACISSPSYCSALLEYDNWEFKNDYPYKL